jgi:queuosine precursor transporter
LLYRLLVPTFTANHRLFMIQKILNDKPSKLFLVLTAFFVANALIAECIGGKLFSLERVFGITPHPFTFLGEKGLTFTLTCGVLLWPLEFVMTDIVNEYYGPKAVRRISYIAIALIAYAFLMFYVAMKAPAEQSFWVGSKKDQGIPDMQVAFSGIFGQGLWIIFGSLVAFLVSQLVDVWIFHKVKKVTGDKQIWLRATGSTMVSQLVDSFIVLFIAFKIGNNWSYQRVLAIGLVNYSYKATMALVLTPLIVIIEKAIARYLGEEVTKKMKEAAMGKQVGLVEPTAG